METNATAALAAALIMFLAPCALASDGTAPAPASAPAASAPAASAPAASAPAASAPAETRPPAQPVGVAPKTDDTQALDSTAIFDQGGALTPRGHLIIEPSFQYAHSSSNQVALVGYTIIPSITVGLIDIKNVESDSLIGAMSLRYGIFNRLEGEVKVPYVYRTNSTSSNSAGSGAQNVTNVFNADGDGLGDVEFGLRYQLNKSGGNAYYLLALRAKSNTGKGPFDVPTDPSTGLETKLPTGSGFWGLQPGLTVIVPSDPAVFFGSVSYMINFDRNINGYGRVDPGDIIDLNFGLGFALNEKTSIILGYDHSIVGRVKINGAYLEGTMVDQLGTLLIGYSYRENERVSFSVTLGAGLTNDAPGVQLTFKMPYSL
jgi:hypothetical protein